MRYLSTTYFILTAFVLPLFVSAENYDYTVAKDGSGDFTTVQAAIDATPGNQRKTIYIKAGVYNEKVMIGSHTQTSDKQLNIIGENAETTIITWDDYNGKVSGMGTPQSATFTVNATDFYAENLTIENTYQSKQAVALYNVADRQVFKNCRIIGYQDTHYLKKGRRSYFYNCYIEGGTDYICAGGTALFENCTLHSVRTGSYITAPEDITVYRTANGKKYYYGFVFLNCRLTSDAGVEVYLGRPWQGTSSSVFLNCTMENIKQEGWSVWSGNNHQTSFFAEYNSLNNDGSPIDITQRASWSYQLSAEEVAAFYKKEDIFSTENFAVPFNPFPLVNSVKGPSDETDNDIRSITDFELYSLSGNLIFRHIGTNIFETSFADIQSGIYILKTKNTGTKKIFINK